MRLQLNLIQSWLHAHALLLMLLLGTLFTMCWLLLLRKRLDMSWYAAIPLSILHTIYGVFCVKIFAFAESGFSKNDFSSMSLFGAVFLMPAAYWLGAKLFRRKPEKVFDIFTVCVVFTLLCARCNCLVAGCCQGRLIGDSGLRWPTREAEIVFYLLFLGLTVPRVWKQRTRGELYPLYMIAYGSFRFFIEFFREATVSSVFHISHIWAAISLALGIFIYLAQRHRKSQTPANVQQPKSKKR